MQDRVCKNIAKGGINEILQYLCCYYGPLMFYGVSNFKPFVLFVFCFVLFFLYFYVGGQQ